MRLVEQIMGLPVSIDIPGAKPADFGPVYDRLRQIDMRFSPYKTGSEVSKFAAGQLKEDRVSRELKEIINACRATERATDGYFSAWYAGQFDPSGYVKGWAIAQAAKVIEKRDYKTYCIGAGGDILAASDSSKVWQIGIQDPLDKSKILNKLSITSGAVCTSGNYERGAHIFNPKTKQPTDELLSVSVTGPDIIQADILATAGFAMGQKAHAFFRDQPGYEALIIDATGRRLNTPGFNRRSRGSNR